MNKKKGYLSALIGLFAIIGLVGVTSCVSEGPTNTASYFEYIPPDTAIYGVSESGIVQRMTMAQVEDLVKDYLHYLNDSNIQVDEIIEFDNDFYVRFTEKDTGINAFEVLINPWTGHMFPEHGPYTMWNTKYTAWPKDMPSGPMTIGEEEAWMEAKWVIDDYIPDGEPGIVERFYGYYTVPVLRQGNMIGLLSINGYTGAVCYQVCHGSLIGRSELW